MCKESLKQGAIATEPKPDPHLNTDHCKLVPSRQATQVERDQAYLKTNSILLLDSWRLGYYLLNSV